MVLEMVKPLPRGPAALEFPGRASGQPLTEMVLGRLLRDMACEGQPDGAPLRVRDAEGRAIVPNAFRSSFKG